ncbi:hypothetical protein RQP46_002985 [Phenoliferia psychrophenolica]
MSYARIATLPVEFGLYSGFSACLVYTFFGTSKDAGLGPITVVSLQVSKVIADVQASGGSQYSGPVIATSLALSCGIVLLLVGLLRLGRLIEFLPGPAIAAFSTGNEVSPALPHFRDLLSTRAPTYEVIINSLKLLPSTNLNAAFGIPALAFLYFTRNALRRLEARTRNPIVKRFAFFAGNARVAFTLIILTLAAFLHIRDQTPKSYDISVLGKIPAGLGGVGVPTFSMDLLKRVAPAVPITTIILLAEHIAVGKSFGKINNYLIIPNQEAVAVGVSNTVTAFFGGMPTPLTGWVSALIVLLALYLLAGALAFIPNAALAAVIIHAVLDVISSPADVYAIWKASPAEAVIWFASVITAIFSSLENGIWLSVAASLALLLVRTMFPRGDFTLVTSDTLSTIPGDTIFETPRLRVVVFDFSAVAHVDATSSKALMDVKLALESYADGPVTVFFANVMSPWVKRGLLAAGFVEPTDIKDAIKVDLGGLGTGGEVEKGPVKIFYDDLESALNAAERIRD